MAKFNGIEVPADGQKITVEGDRLKVPDRPIIPFIEGDGIGRDIWRASQRVFDAAVEKAFQGKRSVAWYEIFAGEKAFNAFGEWLPEDSVKAIAEFAVAIKGPLTTPVGGGIRSLKRHPSPGAGPLCLRPAGALLRRSAFAGQAPGKSKCGYLSRKHRRCLRRHRVPFRQ
jgi:hypothetical protein